MLSRNTPHQLTFQEPGDLGGSQPSGHGALRSPKRAADVHDTTSTEPLKKLPNYQSPPQTEVSNQVLSEDSISGQALEGYVPELQELDRRVNSDFIVSIPKASKLATRVIVRQVQIGGVKRSTNELRDVLRPRLIPYQTVMRAQNGQEDAYSNKVAFSKVLSNLNLKDKWFRPVDNVFAKKFCERIAECESQLHHTLSDPDFVTLCQKLSSTAKKRSFVKPERVLGLYWSLARVCAVKCMFLST